MPSLRLTLLEQAKVERSEEMKAAIYCRVSTEDQEREGTSLQTQLEACLAYCEQKGHQASSPPLQRDLLRTHHCTNIGMFDCLVL